MELLVNHLNLGVRKCIRRQNENSTEAKMHILCKVIHRVLRIVLAN